MKLAITRWKMVSIVKALARQEDEVVDGVGDFIGEQVDGDITFGWYGE
jgi:hypothetical protein